jgi:hypothetical protein
LVRWSHEKTKRAPRHFPARVANWSGAIVTQPIRWRAIVVTLLLLTLVAILAPCFIPIDEARAVQIARHAVSRHGDQTEYYFSAHRDEGYWVVSALRVSRYTPEGKPIFVLGQFRTIAINRCGWVVNYMIGY